MECSEDELVEKKPSFVCVGYILLGLVQHGMHSNATQHNTKSIHGRYFFSGIFCIQNSIYIMCHFLEIETISKMWNSLSFHRYMFVPSK